MTDSKEIKEAVELANMVIAEMSGENKKAGLTVYKFAQPEIGILAKSLLFLHEQNSLLEEKVRGLERILEPRSKIVEELKAIFPDVPSGLAGLPEIGTDMLLERLNKINKEIEDATSVWGYIVTHASTWSTHPPGTFIQELITHKAKLIRVEKV